MSEGYGKSDDFIADDQEIVPIVPDSSGGSGNTNTVPCARKKQISPSKR